MAGGLFQIKHLRPQAHYCVRTFSSESDERGLLGVIGMNSVRTPRIQSRNTGPNCPPPKGETQDNEGLGLTRNTQGYDRSGSHTEVPFVVSALLEQIYGNNQSCVYCFSFQSRHRGCMDDRSITVRIRVIHTSFEHKPK